MSLTLRRTKGSQLTWDEVDANWTAGRAFDGNITLTGEGTAWDDLFGPLQTAKLGAVDKPPWDTTLDAYMFPRNDVTHILYMTLQLPHQWAGTTVFPHVHWIQQRNETPVFKLDYKWSPIGGEVPAGWLTYTMDQLVKPYTSGNMHQISNGAAGIDGAGKGMSSILQVRLYRDDNVYAASVPAMSLDVHYEIDSFGSNSEYSKT